MATTKSSDLVVLPVLADAITAANKKYPVLLGSEAVIERAGLPVDSGGRPSTQVQLPYFAMTGGFEDVPEGVGIAPKKMSVDSDVVTVAHASMGLDLTGFARMVSNSGQDPYAEGGKQFAAKKNDYLEGKLIALLSSTSNKYQLNDSSTDIDFDVILDAKQLWGDEKDRVTPIVFCRSEVSTALAKKKDLNGQYVLRQPTTPGEQPAIWSMRGVVSDQLPEPVQGVYKSYLVLPGTIGLWYTDPILLEQIDASAHTTATYNHLYWVAAVYRYNPTSPGQKKGIVEILHTI
jgi:hypothetical protein